MNYKQIVIHNSDPALNEVLIALLATDFEGFEERDDALVAFVAEQDFNEPALLSVLEPYNCSYTVSDIEKTNWNRQWEANFQPVIVPDFCTVRADFHDLDVTTPYEIIITPKMSFGTGHHATTQLMMRMMRSLDFKNKTVLDFGTGTGILAILAEMMGAREIHAVDNDEWSYENALENAGRNKSGRISILSGSLEDVSRAQFDIILANINRHILLRYMSQLYDRTADGGNVLMSGLLAEDKDIITTAASAAGFRLEATETEHNWIALLFSK